MKISARRLSTSLPRRCPRPPAADPAGYDLVTTSTRQPLMGYVLSTFLGKLVDRLANASHGGTRVTHHERRVEPQHAVPRANERAIPARVGVSPSLVIRAVDL